MVPFVYLASVCWSLQRLISALTQTVRGGLVFRFACSVVLRGGRGAADKCHWRVRRALAVFLPHWVCPAHGIVLPPSTLLRLQAAVQGAGPELHAVPVLGPPQKGRLIWACVLCLPWPSSSGTQKLEERTLPGCDVPYPFRGHSFRFHAHWSAVPCVCSGELVSSRNTPSRCQPSINSGSLWLETGSLFAVW